MSLRLAPLLATLGWIAALLAALVATVGPLIVQRIGLSISEPWRATSAAAVLATAAIWSARGPGRLLDLLARSSLPALATAASATLLLLVVLATRGAVSVGGADSAGYLAQAQRWTTGSLHAPLLLDVPALEDAAWRQSPLGFRPDPSGTQTVPSYPPGLPLLQAAMLTLGNDDAAVRGVPLASAAVALMAVYAIARHVSGPTGAAVAVAALASVPVMLFQSLQPMSDVPALAAWLVALACAPRPGRPAVAGLAVSAGTAIAIRPNLAPLVAAVGWQILVHTSSGADRRRRLIVLAASLVVPVAAIAALQWSLYGSPVMSGYGRASELFSWRHLATNVVLYPAWFRASTSLPATTLLSAGAGALLTAAVRQPRLRPLAAAAAITAGLYLVYVPFDSWTYLRFVLLPIALAAVGLAVLAETAVAWASPRWRFPAFAALVVLVALPNVAVAGRLGVFEVGARELRYQLAGDMVRTRLAPETVVIAGQHSASVSYYAGRPIIRADLVDARALLVLTDWAASQGRPVAFVLDVDEVDAFRSRTHGVPLGALDWPPRVEIGRPVVSRVWMAGDRATYYAGGPVSTSRLLPPRH